MNELEESLVKAGHDPDARGAFYRRLLESDLWFLVEDDGQLPAGPSSVARGDEKFRALAVEVEGSPHIAIFTAYERAIPPKPDPKLKVLGIRGDTLLGMLIGQNLAINLGHSHGLLMPASMARSLLDGSIFRPPEPPRSSSVLQWPAGTKIVVGDVGETRAELKRVLTRALRRVRSVRSASMFTLTIENQPEGVHALVVIDADGANHDSVLAALGAAVAQGPGFNEPVDFTFDDTPDLRAVRSGAEVFYRRRWWQVF